MSCKNKQSARLLEKVLTVSILYPGWNRMGLSLRAPRTVSLRGKAALLTLQTEPECSDYVTTSSLFHLTSGAAICRMEWLCF